MGTTILATAAGPGGGLDALAVLLALAAVGLWPAAVDRLSRSPKFGRLDAMLHRALGGDREVDRG